MVSRGSDTIPGSKQRRRESLGKVAPPPLRRWLSLRGQSYDVSDTTEPQLQEFGQGLVVLEGVDCFALMLADVVYQRLRLVELALVHRAIRAEVWIALIDACKVGKKYPSDTNGQLCFSVLIAERHTCKESDDRSASACVVCGRCSHFGMRLQHEDSPFAVAWSAAMATATMLSSRRRRTLTHSSVMCARVCFS